MGNKGAVYARLDTPARKYLQRLAGRLGLVGTIEHLYHGTKGVDGASRYLLRGFKGRTQLGTDLISAKKALRELAA